MGAAAQRTASGTQCRAAYLDGAGLRDDPKGAIYLRRKLLPARESSTLTGLHSGHIIREV
jgi:hypothetical protein